MNWGIKILVLYLAFVGLILALVITCFGHKTELEYKDYYARELNFQDQINASENANTLKSPIDYTVKNKSLEIKIPLELVNTDLKGSIQLLRPSDSSQDKTIPLNVNGEGKQIIEEDNFQKGVYKMSISVISLGKTYYKESIINFK